MKRPRPTPKKVFLARTFMSEKDLHLLSDRAHYVGSSHHKDVPSMGLVPSPRQGAITFEKAEEQGINNPDCTICPRKWARQDTNIATELLRKGIRLGQIILGAPDELPGRVYVRDPENRSIVYEAKRISDNAYKAYPLTTRQTRALPFAVK